MSEWVGNGASNWVREWMNECMSGWESKWVNELMIKWMSKWVRQTAREAARETVRETVRETASKKLRVGTWKEDHHEHQRIRHSNPHRNTHFSTTSGSFVISDDARAATSTVEKELQWIRDLSRHLWLLQCKLMVCIYAYAYPYVTKYLMADHPRLI